MRGCYRLRSATQSKGDTVASTTAKYRVLRALRHAEAFSGQFDADDIDRGGWVPAHYLTTATIGGSEGLRRLRELRAEGHPIQGPRRFGKGATRYYRIVSP
jgi:hypothetical protein